MVKFRNDTPKKFTSLHVNIAGKEFDFKNLDKGKSTKFVPVEMSFSYCTAWVTTENKTITNFPLCFTGERIYTSGKLIMKISIEEKDGIKQIKIKSKHLFL
ncbi:hypothetical protein QEG73_00865 [Chitinophagaceae bacterium 26-R-25]|nr:hypothetical protein [Chitinophagaceae bacterium 26-R-25]